MARSSTLGVSSRCGYDRLGPRLQPSATMRIRSACIAAAAWTAAATLTAAACSSAPAPPSTAAIDDPAKLAAPPAGQGVQLKTDAFTVPASTEIQACYFFKVKDLEQQAGLDPTQPL